MNRLRDTDEFQDEAIEDREISLGTPTILGIFFLLALVCACFFGFGYTLGRKSAPSAVTAVDAAPSLGAAAKPAAGSPAASAPTPPDDLPASAVVVPNSPGPNPAAATPASAPAATPPPPATKNAANPADGLIAGDKIPAAAPPSLANPQPTASFMVQVAAVSSQDVADIELAALKKDGYAVVVRREPQDSLLHVQIGPFGTRKEADAMRQRVLADGFNAIVK